MYTQGQIYKTRGGGHSIQFTDVEILKHNHPHQSGKEKAFRPPTPKNRLPRRSTRLVTKAKGGAGFRRGVPRIGSTISSSSSDSSGSSLESSMEDQWTDVETRVRQLFCVCVRTCNCHVTLSLHYASKASVYFLNKKINGFSIFPTPLMVGS